MMYEEMHSVPERPVDKTRKIVELIGDLKQIPKDVDGMWDPRVDRAVGRAICIAEEVETLLQNYVKMQAWGEAWRNCALNYYSSLMESKA